MGFDPSRRDKSADHYNTGEIILRLEKDRKRAILLFFGGLAALLIVVLGFYAFSSHRSRVPVEVATPASVPAVVPARPSLSPKPQAPPAPAAVRVKVSLAKPAPAWVDGQSQGVKKAFELSLAPGKHEIKVRFGRKTLSESIAVNEASPVMLFFDPRKKRAVVRAIP